MVVKNIKKKENMKFTVSKALISDALRKVTPVATKGALPILANVKVEANKTSVTFVTSDLDLSVIASIPCNVIEEGATTLPAKILSDAIGRAADGDVSIEVSSATEKAKISAGTSTFRLTGLPAADFPKFPSADDHEVEFTIPQSVLKEVLRRTVYAMSKDDTRRTLKGLNLKFAEGKLVAAATDGRRLAVAEYVPETAFDFEVEVTVPDRTVVELARHVGNNGEAVISRKNSQMSVKLSDGLTLMTRLVDDTYPNYRQVIPKESPKTIIVDRAQLISAIERVSVFSENNTIKLSFASGVLTLSSESADMGDAKDDVAIKYDGEPFEARYNNLYLLDVLKSSDDDEITFLFSAGSAPVIVKDSQPGLAVIMPLRIS